MGAMGAKSLEHILQSLYDFEGIINPTTEALSAAFHLALLSGVTILCVIKAVTLMCLLLCICTNNFTEERNRHCTID